MTTPAPPANGDTVALIGLVSTTLLRRGEVKNFIWSAFYAAFVSQGYAQVYSGSGPVQSPSFYVKSVNGSRPDPAGNVTVAAGGVTNPAVAAIVSASGATRDAVDARAKAVGDNNYAPKDGRYVRKAPPPTGVAATDTANLAAEAAAATAAGGGTIQLQAGTYVVSNLPLSTAVEWKGLGWKATILKLANAANAAVFVTDNFATLAGTSVSSLLNAPHGFTISDLSVDGNAAQQTSAPAAINMYGHSYAMQRVHVRNCYTQGVYSEFGLSGSIAADIGLPSYEPRVEDIDIHHCGSWGWQHKGPTDGLFSRVVIWKTGESVDSGAFWLERGNGVNFNHCHTFGHAGWSLRADAQFFSANCQWEIGERRPFTSQAGGVWVRFDDSVIVGGAIYYISTAGQRDGIGLRLGDSPNGKFAVRTWVDTAIYGCQGGSASTAGIHFNGTSNAVVRALVGVQHPSGAASATTAIHGAPAATDQLEIKVSGVTVDQDRYQNNGAATTAQGAKADTAVQRSSLSLEPIETVPRWAVSSQAALVSGTMRLTYFTPSVGATVASVVMGVKDTAAAATPTLCRVGLYSVASSGDLTLLTATNNDTALWNATNSVFTRALAANQALVAGQRYAVGFLIVTSGAAPALASAAGSMFGDLTARGPRLAGAISGQTDLPASILNASVVNTSPIYYATFNQAT